MSTEVQYTESLPVASSHLAAPCHKAAVLRDAVLPTTSYVSDDYAQATAYHSGGLYVDFADVDATTLEVGLECSRDGVTWSAVMEDDPASPGDSIPWERSFSPNDVDTSSTPWTGSAHFAVSLAGAMNFVRTKTKRSGGTAVGTVSTRLVPGVSV